MCFPFSRTAAKQEIADAALAALTKPAKAD